MKEGFAKVTPMTLPGFQPNYPSLQNKFWFADFKYRHRVNNEKIPYNDCLYSNMYRYEYITVLDTDEIIVPVQEWKENIL